MLDGQTLLLILLACVILFGPSKLPELARSLGKAAGEFKKAQIESETDVRRFKVPIKEPKIVSQNIIKLATDLGIKTEGKDENLLLDEIKAIVKKNGLVKF